MKTEGLLLSNKVFIIIWQNIVPWQRWNLIYKTNQNPNMVEYHTLVKKMGTVW